VLAPQGPALYGSVDKVLGLRRRFSRSGLRALLKQNGLRVKEIRQMNKISTPGWWLFGKVLRRKQVSKLSLKLFDKTIWIWRRIDPVLPWRGLSLIAVATKE